MTQNLCGANPASHTGACYCSQLVMCHLLLKSPLLNQQMLIYGWKMIITMFIIIAALQRERKRAVYLSTLMNLCQAQSQAPYDVTNFYIAVLFVNQCLFICLFFSR